MHDPRFWLRFGGLLLRQTAIVLWYALRVLGLLAAAALSGVGRAARWLLLGTPGQRGQQRMARALAALALLAALVGGWWWQRPGRAAPAQPPAPTELADASTPTIESESAPAAPPTAESSRPAPAHPTTQPRPPVSGAGTLRVTFIDVGQGDSILLEAPDGAVALIDGGWDNGLALEYLAAHHIAHLNLVIASHPHADHIGGLVEVMRALPVDQVWTSGATHTTGIFEQFLDTIGERHIPYNEAQPGDTIPFGAFGLVVLNGHEHGELNNSSLVLRLQYDQVSFLLTGDAEAGSEHEMLQAVAAQLPSTILKVGHHGSYTSSAPEFLAAVRPAVAIYSAGRGNSYGHPHASTLENLHAAGATVYGTSRNGSVVVSTDGATYTVTPERGEAQP